MDDIKEEKRQAVKDALLSGPAVAELTRGRTVVILEALDDWFVVSGGQHFPYTELVTLREPPWAPGLHA